MTRRKNEIKLTPGASKLMHESCRHINDNGMLVVVDVNGIVTVSREADRWELAKLTRWGLLCFAERAKLDDNRKYDEDDV